MSVADSLQRLDVDWVEDVLRRGGHTQADLASLEVEPVVFTGATTDMARLRVRYSDSGRPGPDTLIAKIRGVNEVQRGMDDAMELFAREARFYTTLADKVPTRTPTCFYVGDGNQTPLLLEDLGGLRMGDQMQGLSVADAEAAMDALADLHALFWESDTLQAPWLVSPAEGAYAAMITQLVSSGAPALAARFEGQVPDNVIESVVDAAPQWGTVLARCADGPQTLVHNDCRLDNMFFDHDGVPVFIDWQVPARTRGTQDVGNLLAGSMNSDELADNWEQLLRRYHARLLGAGVAGYSFDECLDQYRVNILYPLGAGMALLGVMDIGDGRGLGEAIVLRCLKHIADLDSFGAL